MSRAPLLAAKSGRHGDEVNANRAHGRTSVPEPMTEFRGEPRAALPKRRSSSRTFMASPNEEQIRVRVHASFDVPGRHELTACDLDIEDQWTPEYPVGRVVGRRIRSPVEEVRGHIHVRSEVIGEGDVRRVRRVTRSNRRQGPHGQAFAPTISLGRRTERMRKPDHLRAGDGRRRCRVGHSMFCRGAPEQRSSADGIFAFSDEHVAQDTEPGCVDGLHHVVGAAVGPEVDLSTLSKRIVPLESGERQDGHVS